MKKTFYSLCLIACIVLATAACQQSPALPSPTDEPEPTKPPAPVVISAGNAASLTPVFSRAVSAGFLKLEWAADGSTIWAMHPDGIALLNGMGGETIAEFIPDEYTAVYDVSPDGRTIAYTSEGAEVRLYDVVDESDILTITPDFPFSDASFSSDGKLLGIQSLMDIKIVQWDTASGKEKGSLSGYGTAAPVYSAQYGADGKTLLWFSRGTVQPMAINSQVMGPTLSHEDFVTSLAISPDGSVVATTAAGMIGGEFLPLLTQWDAESGEILRQNAIPTYFSSTGFSPDSKLIAAATEEGVFLFTVPHGDEIAKLEDAGILKSIAFSPDGKKLATGSDTGTLTMYEVLE